MLVGNWFFGLCQGTGTRRGNGNPCCKSQLPARHLHGGNCKCRKRFDAGVPGAAAPGEVNLVSPLPAGKGLGDGGEKQASAG